MTENNQQKLASYLSPAGAWAFALGTSIGWGSLVVTANTYLAQSGPAGSVLGLIIGAVIMLVISRNYAYLMSCYPEAGGAYTFYRETIGYDHAFLAAWFLALTYLAILWANATSLPLFARFFLGNIFHFGKMYTIFGYEVYFGEVLLSSVFLLITAVLCTRSQKITGNLMVGMAILFTLGITICFAGAVTQTGFRFEPAFVPDKNELSQIIRIAIISPWAFIGFENISHFTEEFSFKHDRSFRILVISVITSTLLYICVTLLSVTAYPEGYENWLEYIRDLGNLDGINGLPAFYAAEHYLGKAGLVILVTSLLALILTSLIGNITALSRLFYALGKDRILPSAIGTLNSRSIPENAIKLITAISIFIPLLGRTAIGWIVDVTTMGAALIYGYVSAAAYRTALLRNDRVEKLTGRIGLWTMVGFGIYLLVPNLYSASSIEPESYFLFVLWAVLGFIVFRLILKNDKEKKFGKSIIVWIALLSLIIFVSLVWMNQSIMNVTGFALNDVETVAAEAGLTDVQEKMISGDLRNINAVSRRSITVIAALFILSLGILINSYSTMSRKADHSEKQMWLVMDMAGRDPLTGVKSKLAYTDVEKEINASINNGTVNPFSLAVLDVNGLKKINDTKGHKAGDDYIQQASHMICSYFGHSPVFRIGGDEFAVLLREADYENRETILNDFKRESESHISSNGVVISAGLSDYREGDRDLRTIFERADAQMYENKKYLKSMGAEARF